MIAKWVPAHLAKYENQRQTPAEFASYDCLLKYVAQSPYLLPGHLLEKGMKEQSRRAEENDHSPVTREWLGLPARFPTAVQPEDRT